MAAPKKAKPAFSAKAIVSGKTYEGTGTTAADAISAIKIPGLPHAKLILTVSKGGIYRTRIFQPMMAARLFSPSPLTREIALKNMATLFSGL